MQNAFKIVVILFITWVYLKSVRWVWISEIDIRATARRFLNGDPPISKVLISHAPNKIYQNGLEVGNVSGSVDEMSDIVTFSELSETSGLDKSKPFKYREKQLKIRSIESTMGVLSVTTDKGSIAKTAVLVKVVCDVVK